MTKFWEALGSRLADRWLEVSATALVFWAAVAATWASGQQLSSLRHRARDFASEPVALQILAIAAGLLIVTLSAVIVGALTRPLQRLAEGYWPRPLRFALDRLTARQDRKRRMYSDKWQALAQDVFQDRPTKWQREEFLALDRFLEHFPKRPETLRPTYVGNLLAAANEEPFLRYGLDPYTVWPHLRLLLPTIARAEFDSAQKRLDSALGAIIWGLAFCGLIFVRWWALPAGLAFALAGWLALRPRAEALADISRVSWSLYRVRLYRQLGWPPPRTPAEEMDCGQRLSSYLARGSDDTHPTFTWSLPERLAGHKEPAQH